MITLEQYDQIRRMYYLEEKSGQQIAKKYVLAIYGFVIGEQLRFLQICCGV